MLEAGGDTYSPEQKIFELLQKMPHSWGVLKTALTMPSTNYSWDQVVEAIREFADANPRLDGSGHGRGGRGRGGTDNVHYGGDTTEMCRNFAMGKCKRGSSCKYQHSQAPHNATRGSGRGGSNATRGRGRGGGRGRGAAGANGPAPERGRFNTHNSSTAGSARGDECYNCGKHGHYSAQCPNKSSRTPAQGSGSSYAAVQQQAREQDKNKPTDSSSEMGDKDQQFYVYSARESLTADAGPFSANDRVVRSKGESLTTDAGPLSENDGFVRSKGRSLVAERGPALLTKPQGLPYCWMAGQEQQTVLDHNVIRLSVDPAKSSVVLATQVAGEGAVPCKDIGAPPAYTPASFADFELSDGLMQYMKATNGASYNAQPNAHRFKLPRGATVVDGGATCSITTSLDGCTNMTPYNGEITVGGDHVLRVEALVTKTYDKALTGAPLPLQLTNTRYLIAPHSRSTCHHRGGGVPQEAMYRHQDSPGRPRLVRHPRPRRQARAQGAAAPNGPLRAGRRTAPLGRRVPGAVVLGAASARPVPPPLRAPQLR